MDMEIVMTNSQNVDFIKLIGLLDEDLDGRYGELQKKYKQHLHEKTFKIVLTLLLQKGLSYK